MGNDTRDFCANRAYAFCTCAVRGGHPTRGLRYTDYHCDLRIRHAVDGHLHANRDIDAHVEHDSDDDGDTHCHDPGVNAGSNARPQ